jgi:2-oxoglutarate ferredoxin oxidoreductase subunit delta
MTKVVIDEILCKGCGMCIMSCPKGIMELNKEKINGKGYNPVYVTDISKCNGCGACAIMCPDIAITAGSR